MHPLNGTTSSQKFVNISDVIPALTWYEHDHFSVYFAFASLKLPFLGGKWDNMHENDIM
jgi:hypothetical protein